MSNPGQDCTKPQFFYPIKHLVLSHSTSTSYRSCARKGIEFRKLYGAQTVELDEWGFPVDNFAADVGKCLHEGYQSYLVDADEDKAAWAMMLKYPVRSEPMQENKYRSMEASWATLLAMINGPLRDRYELIKIRTADGQERHAVEVPYVIEFVGAPLDIPVYHVGLIDAILYDKYERRYLVVDIKTHRDNTHDLSLRYEFDEQCVPYGLILEHILEHPIDDFTVAYLSCYVDLLEPSIRLYEFNKTKDNIRDWLIGQMIDIKHIAFYMKNQWFPRATNGQTCMAFRKRCAFAELCAYRDPQVLSRFIQGSPRETLFHDGKEPWITVKIPYAQDLVGV